MKAHAKNVAFFHRSAIETLVFFLRLLLFDTPGDRILKFSEKVLDKSISLKTAMTEEQAIYRCYFKDGGDDFDSDWMEVASGEIPRGVVSMCTFPGMRRFTTRNGIKEFVAVVKATAKLDSA